jgi:hypothetical protein
VAEVNPGLEQLLHGDLGHCFFSFLRWLNSSASVFPGEIPAVRGTLRSGRGACVLGSVLL